MSLHIPKTAGITLLRVLACRYGQRLQRAYQPPREGLEQTETDGWPDIADPACIHGHGVLRRYPHLIEPNPRHAWITFLREPLASAVSSYHHNRRHVPWNPAHAGRWEDVGLERFLLEGYNHNRYAQWLGKARRGIEDFVLVGVTERFDESMWLLYHTLGWEPIGYRPVNVGGYAAPALSGELVAEFRQRNAADYVLYQQAMQRLDRMITACGASFAANLAAFSAGTGSTVSCPAPPGPVAGGTP